jgi:hypothetical protein
MGIVTFENQLPTPPVDMVMPAANTAIAIICYVLLACFACWAAYEGRRTRSAIPLLVLVGGALTALNEPLLDHVGAIWYPQFGPAPVFRAFNVSLPVWAVAAYGLYVGGLSNIVYKWMSKGMSRTQLWSAYFSIWVFNLGLELPGLNLGIYRYYGDPALNFFGFPLCWAMTNVTIPILVSSVLIGYRGLFVGARALLLLPLVPMIGAAAESAAGWPSWLSLNAGVGPTTKLLAAFATLGCSMLITYLVGIKVCAKAS